MPDLKERTEEKINKILQLDAKIAELEAKLNRIALKENSYHDLEANEERLDELEEWKDKSWNMHQKMAQDILPDQIERLEKKLEECLEEKKKFSERAHKLDEIPHNQFLYFEDRLEKLEKWRNANCPSDPQKAFENMENEVDNLEKQISELKAKLDPDSKKAWEFVEKVIKEKDGEISVEVVQKDDELDSLGYAKAKTPSQLSDSTPSKCSECGGYRMGKYLLHNDGCSQSSTTSTAKEATEAGSARQTEKRFLPKFTHITSDVVGNDMDNDEAWEYGKELERDYIIVEKADYYDINKIREHVKTKGYFLVVMADLELLLSGVVDSDNYIQLRKKYLKEDADAK